MGWMSKHQAIHDQNILPLSSILTTGKASFLAFSIVLGPMLGHSFVLASDGEAVPEAVSSRFTCEIQDGEYTVMYRPKSDPGQAYPWAVPAEMGGGWTPERRCETISARLENYRPDGLVELRTDIENGYNIVCATTEENLDACQIVFTVPPGQDPVATRDAVFSNIALADAGTGTNAVNTFVGSRRLPDTEWSTTGILNDEIFGAVSEILGTHSTHRPSEGIYLKPYLDPSDGGTGLHLHQSGQPLNPDNFR